MFNTYYLNKDTEKFVNRRCDIKNYPYTMVSVPQAPTEAGEYKAFLRDPDSLQGYTVTVMASTEISDEDSDAFLNEWYQAVAKGLDALYKQRLACQAAYKRLSSHENLSAQEADQLFTFLKDNGCTYGDTIFEHVPNEHEKHAQDLLEKAADEEIDLDTTVAVLEADLDMTVAMLKALGTRAK